LGLKNQRFVLELLANEWVSDGLKYDSQRIDPGGERGIKNALQASPSNEAKLCRAFYVFNVS
jgi:hypothetical protein